MTDSTKTPLPASGGELYDRAATRSASVIIREYSTSFGLAAKLLDARTRTHVTNIYALVRIADEIVDGIATLNGLSVEETTMVLAELEAETESAMQRGYSSNLVVHAFAKTARSTGFGSELTSPFFASMRTDLTVRSHTPDTIGPYIYGSAEVVGLMCLRAFLLGRNPSSTDLDELEDGARHLGAAFQKVNFLRDLKSDYDGLGRNYFPGVNVNAFSDADRDRILDDIDDDLRISAGVVDRLPDGSRRAVWAAQLLFTELADRLRRTPAEELRSRISVPNTVKAKIAVSAMTRRRAHSVREVR